ncbi:MAG TPA: hypothetical protein VM074_02650 [Solimonas sp.]|nr:hypothetical protein [Solimonas sp.]
MLSLAACATLHHPLAEGGPPAELRAELGALTGRTFRRINRYIELSLLGAARCRAELGSMAPGAALYLCTDIGMLADTSRIVSAMLSERRVPTPFEFMNVSGSMASFQVAQHLGLEGPQLSLHRSHAGFEAALQFLELKSAPHRQALVGFVEEGCWPLAEQRERLHWPEGLLAECSHWFYFDADAAMPRARVESCMRHVGWESLAASVATLERERLWLSGCERSRNTADLDGWGQALGIGQLFRPLVAPSLSGGLTALALGAFVEQVPAGRLLHVNRAGGDEYYATVLTVRRVGGAQRNPP